MLYQFLLNFVDTFSFLNVFKYLTFRTGLSFFTSLVIVLIVGGPFIKFFSKQKILNPIRDDGPEDHIVKKIGTPTMGGLIILSGLLVSVIFGGISKAKKGRILINKSQIIELIRKDLNNNDYLMIKASLATGFNDIVKGLKGFN